MSDKVKRPAQVTVIIGAVMSILAAMGVNLPISEQDALGAADAVFVLIGVGTAVVNALVGYFTRETNPAPSAIAAVRRQG